MGSITNSVKTPSDLLVVAVVLNRNGQADIEQCMAALARQTHPRLEVCVVDNASTDQSSEWVRAHYPSVKVIALAENRGWSGANNVGIRHALERGADFVWLLNNDIDIEPDCVEQMIRFAAAHPDVSILGPLIYYYSRREEIWFPGGWVDFEAFDVGHCKTVAEFRALPSTSRYVSGCAMLVRADVFRRNGLIDERFFIYYEETDFCCREAAAGGRMEVVEKAVLYHKVGAYGGSEAGVTPFRVYHMYRSGLLFWRKHVGWWNFHRRYCSGYLPKHLLGVGDEWRDEGRRALAEAKIDALWYFVRGMNTPRAWPKSPAWFQTLMIHRPWVLAELMAFHFGRLVIQVLKSALRRLGGS
jgi:GT2 family glycosyltransferase